MKIVINACFGGFGLSNEAITLYKECVKSKDRDIVFTDRFAEHRASNNSVHWAHKLLRDEMPSNASKSSPSEPNSSEYIEDIGVIIPRYDPCLIHVVEKLGEKANGSASRLVIAEIPDDIVWAIEEYDGYEWVSQAHQIFTDYPLSQPGTILVGKGDEGQEVYEPPSEYDRPRATIFDELFDPKKGCNTQ